MFEASKNYIIVVLATLLVISVVGIVGLQKSVKATNKDLTEERIQVGALTSTIAQLNQNSKDKDALVTLLENGFKELRTRDQARAQQVAEALAKVEEQTSKNVSLSNKILASSPKSDDLCKEADALINLYIEEIQKMRAAQ